MAARPSPQTERLVALVDAIAEGPDEGLTLSEIARSLGVAPATCHPMLTTLTSLGWLTRHPVRRTFRLGPALAAVGRKAARGLGVLDLARPEMEVLCAEFGLSCTLLTPGEEYVTIADVVRADAVPRESRVRIGDQVPIAPPLGVGYVCWADEQTVLRWLDRAGLGDAQARTLHESVIDAARKRGYAVEQVTGVDTGLQHVLQSLDVELDERATRLRTLLEEVAAEMVDRLGAPVVEVDPDGLYRLGRVSAPVLDGSGEVVLVLALFGFGAVTRGGELVAVGESLSAAAARISAAVHPAP